MLQFRRVGQFTSEAELNRRLQTLQDNIETVVRAIDSSKEDKYVVLEANAGPIQAHYTELHVLDTSTAAIDVFLPRVSAQTAGKRVAVVRLSAGNAVTVRAVGTTVGGAATHAPATGSVVVYISTSKDWQLG